MKKSRDQYLKALDDLIGGGGRIHEITDPDEADPVLVVAYHGVPEQDHTTAFSFGLSSAKHSEWCFGKPELMISVNSNDHAWALCMGEIIKNYRDKCLFEYGTILHFRQRVVDECPMTSFFVFASSLFNKMQQRLVLSDRTINLAQMYPIYEEEASLVNEVGVENFFWEMGIDFCDIGRPLVLRQ
jgi:hypothetical protein